LENPQEKLVTQKKVSQNCLKRTKGILEEKKLMANWEEPSLGKIRKKKGIEANLWKKLMGAKFGK